VPDGPPIPPLDVARFVPFLRAALAEDDAEHDLTVNAVVPADRLVTADLVAQQSGVLAGLALAGPTVTLLDPGAAVTLSAADGDDVGPGTPLASFRGRARSILSAERTLLNVLRHLSGVATLTRSYVEAVMATGAAVYDTRKTTPGWRELEKHAVLCGGGRNHRRGLADALMVKENHLYAAFGRTGPASLVEAIRRCRAAAPPGTPLYVEVETHEELVAVAAERPDVVMLDGFDLGEVRQAVKLVRALPPPRPLLEATGGMSLETVAAYAAAGVQRISVGAITHSAPALDLSLSIRARPGP
jgi:nicotinate-nucleotide pyrophosphorylase (carboxylating)